MRLTKEQWDVLEPLLPKLRKRDDGKGRKVARSQGRKVARSQGRKVARSQGRKVARSQGRKVALSIESATPHESKLVERFHRQIEKYSPQG